MAFQIPPGGNSPIFQYAPVAGKEPETVESKSQKTTTPFSLSADAVPFVLHAREHSTRQDRYDTGFPPISGMKITKVPQAKSASMKQQESSLYSGTLAKNKTDASENPPAQGKATKSPKTPHVKTSHVKEVPGWEKTTDAQELYEMAERLHAKKQDEEALKCIARICEYSDQEASGIGKKNQSFRYYFQALREKADIFKGRSNFQEAIRILRTMESEYEKHFQKFPEACQPIDLDKCYDQWYTTLLQAGKKESAEQLSSYARIKTGRELRSKLMNSDPAKYRRQLISEMGDGCKKNINFIKTYYQEALQRWEKSDSGKALPIIRQAIELQKNYISGRAKCMRPYHKRQLSVYEARCIRWLITL